MKNTFLAAPKGRLFAALTVAIFCGLLSHRTAAQTVTLQQDAFYPDTSVCHTGVPVRFVGRVSYASYPPSSAYTVVVYYGDGAIQTVTKTSPATAVSGSDTFSVMHVYSTSGMKVVKAIAQTFTGAATDSIVRSWDVGGCSGKVSGRVFYDLMQNCTPDTIELGLRNRYVPFVMNSTPRQLWTDSLGRYTCPLFPGDTLKRPAGAIDPFNANVPVSCPYTPVFATATAKNVSVRLVDPLLVHNVQWRDFVCKIPYSNYDALRYEVTPVPQSSSYDYLARIDYGDGSPLSAFFSHSGTAMHFTTLPYQNAGTFTATMRIYRPNFYGPVMEFKHTVHVDTCNLVKVRAFADTNANCVYGQGEAPVSGQLLNYESQMFGPDQVFTDDTGVVQVIVFDGDTVTFTDSVIQIINWPAQDSMVYGACPPVELTVSTTGIQPLPFKPHIYFSGSPFQNTVCLNSPQTTVIGVRAIGVPAGTPLRLRGFYSDGSLDTTVMTMPTLLPGFNAYTLHFNPSHNWMSVPATVVYVLDAPGFSPDTLHVNSALNIDTGCWRNEVRAYRDLNRNCTREASEPWVTDFSVSNGSSTTVQSDATTGIAAVTHTAAWPSVQTVTLPGTSFFPVAQYSVVGTAPFCTWSTPLSPGGAIALPLIDTARFSAFGFVPPVAACSTQASGNLGLQILPNWSSRPYRITLHYGDGLSTSIPFNPATTIASSTYASLSLNAHTYAPGSYTPSLSVYDSVLGATVFTYTHSPAFTIIDTCTGFKGRLFADANANCVYSAALGDAPLAGIAVGGTKNGTPFTVMTDSAGRIRVPAVSGDALMVNVPANVNGRALACSTATPYAYTMASAAVHKPFAYTCDTTAAVAADVSILAGHGVWAPGVVDTLRIYPSGFACGDSAAVLQLSLAPQLSFVSSSLSGASMLGSTISWAVPSVAALPQLIKVAVSVSPSAAPGSWICADASLIPAVADSIPGNNTFLLCDSARPVVPNFYKTASSDSMNAAGALLPGRPIVYTLGFTNTTGDTVHHVVLLDTLSTLLDEATVQMLSASHAHNAQLLGSNVLRITMAGLNLLPGERGFASFAVRPVTSLLPGTAVPNTAHVLLGGMPAAAMSVVVTNPDTTVTNGVAHTPQIAADDITLFPVPADYVVELHATAALWTDAGFEVTDARGARMMRGQLTSGQARWSVHSWAPGLYVVRVHTKSRVVVRKLLVR